jgi:hypothetical protein
LPAASALPSPQGVGLWFLTLARFAGERRVRVPITIMQSSLHSKQMRRAQLGEQHEREAVFNFSRVVLTLCVCRSGFADEAQRPYLRIAELQVDPLSWKASSPRLRRE